MRNVREIQSIFLGLGKNRAITKNVGKLKLPDGKITTDPTEILTAQADYYKKLYSAKNSDPAFGNCFDHVKLLHETDKNKCKGIITVYECEEILKTFKNGKSPGNDGFTIEFYKHFWHELCESLIDSFNYGYKNGELSTSQKQAVISLIEKGNDRLLLKIGGPYLY